MALTDARSGSARLPPCRLDAWAVAGILVAAAVVAPLLVVVGSFFSPRVAELWEITDSILGDVVVNTAVVAGGVGRLHPARSARRWRALVSFYDFPGPALARLGARTSARDPGLRPGVRLPRPPRTRERAARYGRPPVPSRCSRLATYPYVYVLARASFRGQSRNLIEAARSLGIGTCAGDHRLALPLARPALAAGALLAMMEALADFGSVQLLGVKTFTVAIYQVWFGAFDRLAASQLASFLMFITLLILFARADDARQAALHQSDAGLPLERVRLRGPRAAAATLFPVLVLAVAFAGPVVQLVAWALESWDDPLVRSGFGTWARNSFMLGTLAALIVLPTALVLVYGLRVAPSRAEPGVRPARIDRLRGAGLGRGGRRPALARVGGPPDPGPRRGASGSRSACSSPDRRSAWSSPTSSASSRSGSSRSRRR